MKPILTKSTPGAEVQQGVKRKVEPEAPPIRKSKRQPKKNTRFADYDMSFKGKFLK